MSVFNQYARYYDLLYRDKDYAAEVDYIDGLIKRFATQAHDLLEFGSGTGIHGRLLAEKGYRVFGLELSREMVTQAKQTIIKTGEASNPKKVSKSIPGSFDCQEGDIRHTSLGRHFDTILALFHVVSYQTTDPDITTTFQNAYNHLQPGGLFIFDVWYTPAVLFQRPVFRVKRVEDGSVRLIRLAEPTLNSNKDLVDVHYTILAEDIASRTLTTIEETHHMRYFSLPELELLANFTGFTLIHSEEFLTGNTLGENTWGIICVLRRN
jgi:SAM-dependent methyltransferase